jgi:hypothetical protein
MAKHVTVTLDEVRQAWRQGDEGRSDGGNTGGILEWFAPLVARWERMPLSRELLGRMYVIGGEAGSEWARRSGGTFKVSDCAPPDWPVPERSAAVRLVALACPDSERLVLIDGDKRAVSLWHDLSAGADIGRGSLAYIGSVSGFLGRWFCLAAKAVSPFWR